MTRIETPGIYDLSEDVYHADPAREPSLSAGSAKTLISGTPLHCAFEHPRRRELLPHFDPAMLQRKEAAESDPKFDVGRAFHAIHTGKGGQMVVVDAKDWRSKEAKAAREEATAAGDTALLTEQADRVLDMSKAVHRELVGQLGRDPFVDRETNELAMFWRDQDRGVWCRSKPDSLDYASRVLDDLKTSGMLADPEGWTATQLRATAIDLRAAHYLSGAKSLLGTGWRYRFIVVEDKPPHALSILELDAQATETGEDMRRFAVNRFADCLRAGEWPAWAPGVHRVGAPGYHETRWLERRDRIANDPTPSALRAARELQAPN